MVDIVSYTLITITCFCFGLIVSFQIAHIHYCRKLTTLVRQVHIHKNHRAHSRGVRGAQTQKIIFFSVSLLFQIVMQQARTGFAPSTDR